MSAGKTIRRGTLGKRALRLVEKAGRYHGLADGKICCEGGDPNEVWQELKLNAGKADPSYFGFQGARSRFLKFFPEGFRSDEYAGMERDYKIAARNKLVEAAPLQQALGGTGFGEAVLSAFRATNMLSPFENTRLQAVFRGPSADAVVQAAAAFTVSADRASLKRLEAVLQPSASDKWTVATYLPYLWLPEKHMFLKPNVTKDFATRVGHPLASTYEAGLSFDVYASLLDLVDRTRRELVDLGPRDNIDIQSFIWVIGGYQEDGSDDED